MLPHHPAIDIRSYQIAAEHLVGYSQVNVPLFKHNQLEPVKDLKLLVKDYAPIAKNALTILINISADLEVLKDIAKDDAFLELLLSRITVCQFYDTHDKLNMHANMGTEQERIKCERNCNAPRQYGEGRFTTTSPRAEA